MLKNFDVAPALAVKDLDRAKQFYGGTLGFTVKKEMADGVMYESGKTHFLIYPSQFAGTNQATYMGWEVDNIEAVVEDLKSKGVTFEEYDFPGLKTENGIAVLGDVKAAWFKDTEGNILSIDQRLS